MPLRHSFGGLRAQSLRRSTWEGLRGSEPQLAAAWSSSSAEEQRRERRAACAPVSAGRGYTHATPAIQGQVASRKAPVRSAAPATPHLFNQGVELSSPAQQPREPRCACIRLSLEENVAVVIPEAEAEASVGLLSLGAAAAAVPCCRRGGVVCVLVRDDPCRLSVNEKPGAERADLLGKASNRVHLQREEGVFRLGWKVQQTKTFSHIQRRSHHNKQIGLFHVLR